MSVPGAFFEVTGAESELFRIVEAIEHNDGRLTADSSATLDLWQEMLEEWFKLHDAKILKDIKEELRGLMDSMEEETTQAEIYEAVTKLWRAI